jgi:hypothetical protein
MSLGAITVDNEIGRKGGPLSMARISFLGDDSYPTGGTAGFAALVAAKLGVTGVTIEAVVQQNNSDHVARYDKTNDKLLVQLMSTGAEVAGAVDLSGITFELLVIGK